MGAGGTGSWGLWGGVGNEVGDRRAEMGVGNMVGEMGRRVGARGTLRGLWGGVEQTIAGDGVDDFSLRAKKNTENADWKKEHSHSTLGWGRQR